VVAIPPAVTGREKWTAPTFSGEKCPNPNVALGIMSHQPIDKNPGITFYQSQRKRLQGGHEIPTSKLDDSHFTKPFGLGEMAIMPALHVGDFCSTQRVSPHLLLAVGPSAPTANKVAVSAL
jgi:hypothetical protein